MQQKPLSLAVLTALAFGATYAMAQDTRHTVFGTSFGRTNYTAYEIERNYKVNFFYKF